MKQMLLSHLRVSFPKHAVNSVVKNHYQNILKRCNRFVESQDLSLGFNAEMQNTDIIKYIPLYKTLNVLLSHEDALSEVLKSQEVTEDDNALRTYDGSAFKPNSLLNSEKKTLEILLYHDDFGIVNPLGNKTMKYKTSGFILCLEIFLFNINLAKRTSI